MKTNQDKPSNITEAKEEINQLHLQMGTAESVEELKKMFARMKTLKAFIADEELKEEVPSESDGSVNTETPSEPKTPKSYDRTKVIFLILSCLLSIIEIVKPYISKLMEVFE